MTVVQAPQNFRSRPVRLGFLGVGWIGLSRMKSLLGSGFAEAVAIADPNPAMAASAKALAAQATVCGSLDELLEQDMDGLVIATPSALHAQQSIKALDAGVAVFCQKPLGRSVNEVRSVVEAARRNDLPLGLDLSYRHTAAITRIRQLIEDETLGKLHTLDLVFHNGYGPDKPWFYDRRLSGGGCVMDLGIHLVDLALWSLDFDPVVSATSHLRQAGEVWRGADNTVEDLAFATLVTANGALIRIACSWRLNVGREAEISASFHGTRASARFANAGGSFYDFTAELQRGTTSKMLFSGKDDWGGGAAHCWLANVVACTGFDPACLQHVEVAEVLDLIYAPSSTIALRDSARSFVS